MSIASPLKRFHTARTVKHTNTTYLDLRIKFYLLILRFVQCNTFFGWPWLSRIQRYHIPISTEMQCGNFVGTDFWEWKDISNVYKSIKSLRPKIGLSLSWLPIQLPLSEQESYTNTYISPQIWSDIQANMGKYIRNPASVCWGRSRALTLCSKSG